MKILQITTAVNSGSVGRITEDIGKVLMANGHESYIAYGRGNRPSQSKLKKIGNQFDVYMHGLKTAVFDRHGFGSISSTKDLILWIDEIKPDAIGLHNLHGYYLNIQLLFDYLSSKQIPVLWTLFDCWAFTGHCTYFDNIQCEKWVTGCFDCPKTRMYPSGYVFDNSKRNYIDKKKLFNSIDKLEIVVHSNWLLNMVKRSFLEKIPVNKIHSGIDLETFKPASNNLKEKLNINAEKIILGCANKWNERKGLNDFYQLNKNLSNKEVIILVGLSKKQKKELPENIIGLGRTENVQQLAELYSLADVFVNPTYQDNFPTTNIEALACGTPVITYNTGGSPEAIDEYTGMVVEKGDIQGLANSIQQILGKGKEHYSHLCRTRAKRFFNKDDRYLDYLNLYTKMLEPKNNH